MTRFKGFLAILFLSISPLVMAMDLDAAKAQGLLGEQPDGYLGVVQSTPDAVALAADINAKRKAAYEEIARKNGATLAQVAAMTGERVIAKAAAGTYIKTPQGQWQKK